MPWEMDVVTLRRFDNKVFVPMPDKEARKNILKHYAGTHHTLKDKDFEYIAE